MKKIPIIEAGLSIVSIWWAFVLFSSPRMFDHVPGVFIFFTEISQEVGWGIFFLITAFMKLLGLVLENKRLRIVGLYLSIFLYSLISAGYILSSKPVVPGTVIHFVLMLFALAAVREVRNNATID